jgi:hypothetical protein
VSSFLSDPFHSYENRLQANGVIMLRNMREDHKALGERHGGIGDSKDVKVKREAQPNSSSSPPWPPGAAHAKNISQDAYKLCFLCSTYVRKANEISFPMQLVLCQNFFRVNGNHQNKWPSRICPGVATPSLGPLGHVSS